METIADTKFPKVRLRRAAEHRSVTAECPAQSSETTSAGKSSICEGNTHVTKSLRTWAADSTSRDAGFSPYWNEYCRDLSQRLWLPTVTDCAGLDSSLLSGYVFGPEPGSWFSIRQYKAPTQSLSPISSLSLPCSPAESKDAGSTKKQASPKIKGRRNSKAPPIPDGYTVVAKKIRAFPTAEQRSILRNWFGGARKFFNDAADLLKDPTIEARHASSKKYKKQGIGPKLVNAYEWGKEIPYQIRSIAVRDACDAVKKARKENKELASAKAHGRRLTEPFSEVHHRNRFRKQSIFIPHSAISKKGVYCRLLGELKLTEKIPRIHKDSRLTYERGEYHLVIPTLIKKSDPRNLKGFAGLDPGCRTFLVAYSGDAVTEIGSAAFSRIMRLCYAVDAVVSKRAKEKNGHRRCRLKKAENRLRQRIQNLIHELHHQTAHWLTTKFAFIAMPNFNWHRVAENLYDKTMRGLATLAHGKFRHILKHHAIKNGCVIGTGSEAYTSKTNPWTGERKEVGSAKVIRWGTERYRRDHIGAMGITLRALSDTTWDWSIKPVLATCQTPECPELSGV